MGYIGSKKSRIKGILHTTFAVCAALAEKLENHLHISFKEVLTRKSHSYNIIIWYLLVITTRQHY